MHNEIYFPEAPPAREADTVTSERAVSMFDRDGFLFLKNAFPRQLIQSLAAAFVDEYQSMSKSELRKRDAVVGDRRYMITIKIKKPFNDPALYANPLLMPILWGSLGGNVRLASFGAVVAWPGAEAQPVHLDHPPLFDSHDLCDALPPTAITLVVPLVDVTLEMGPTAIWPGVRVDENHHDRFGPLEGTPDYESALQPTTEMGDAYMMDYRTIHGGMANNSDLVRPILYLVYSRPWFRDGFNFSKQPAVQISKKQRKKIPQQWQGLFQG